MIKVGDYITRNSYNNDIIFKVINIKGNTAYLKGINDRLFADCKLDDCIKSSEDNILDDFRPDIINNNLERNDKKEFFYLIPKILHLDGDSEYMARCMEFYKMNNVYAVGKKINEDTIGNDIIGYLEEFRPDILIITGHDSFKYKNGDKNNINNYKNSINFVKAVKQARKYEKSHEKLIIIAGACQSDYEELIKAGANFASSPKRVNIHALDPAIIAVEIALTERNKEINLIEVLSKTKNGVDGMGGLISNGMMYVGYPR